LTGLLILPISDRFIVQWEPLARKYRRCEYYGILV
jgi:beta-1,4-N-acetylglucosaminyltransferase